MKNKTFSAEINIAVSVAVPSLLFVYGRIPRENRISVVHLSISTRQSSTRMIATYHDNERNILRPFEVFNSFPINLVPKVPKLVESSQDLKKKVVEKGYCRVLIEYSARKLTLKTQKTLKHKKTFSKTNLSKQHYC